MIRTLQNEEDFLTLRMIVKSIVAAVSPASHENGRWGLNNLYHTHKRTSREFQYQLTHCGAPRVTGSIEWLQKEPGRLPHFYGTHQTVCPSQFIPMLALASPWSLLSSSFFSLDSLMIKSVTLYDSVLKYLLCPIISRHDRPNITYFDTGGWGSLAHPFRPVIEIRDSNQTDTTQMNNYKWLSRVVERARHQLQSRSTVSALLWEGGSKTVLWT